MTTYYGSLVATAGASTANSYATLAEATDYHDSFPTTIVTEWTGAASDELREDALMWATRLLDSWIDWDGTKADISTTSGVPDQRLEWPRSGVVGPNGEDIDDTIIPQWLKEATAELARQLLIKDLTKEPLRGINMIKAGDITIEFDVLRHKRVLLRSVNAFIWRYGKNASTSFSKQAERV
jgi:hypothetical protein